MAHYYNSARGEGGSGLARLMLLLAVTPPPGGGSVAILLSKPLGLSKKGQLSVGKITVHHKANSARTKEEDNIIKCELGECKGGVKSLWEANFLREGG